MLARVRLRNFKAFEDFTMTMTGDAFIVGPNNAGKSTLISAIRLGASLLRHATARAPSRGVSDTGVLGVGYPIPSDQSVFVEENLRHEFREAETRLELQFANGGQLVAIWPALEDRSEDDDDEDRDPFFYVLVRDRSQPRTTTAVKAAFPAVGVIPMLTPLEHRESVLESKYVRRNQDGRLSSRHFRNQLSLLQEEYSISHASLLQEFLCFAEEWIPEVNIDELVRSAGVQGYQLDLYYREPGFRAEKEIFWAGDGMQVWLQLLLHVFRLRGMDTVVIDEPDVFLHADLQRRLVRLLEGVSAQTITATHSPEMLAEAAPDNVVWVDKTRRRAVRSPNAALMSQIAEAIGSQFNLRLAKALRSKVCLFVEGKDMQLLRYLARAVGADRLSRETGVAVVPLEGFSNWHHVEPFGWLVKNLLEGSVATFVILDRDYRSDAASEAVVARLDALDIRCHVWRRKELESYLLVPHAIARHTKADADWVDAELGAAAAAMSTAVFARALDEKLREAVTAAAHRVSVTEAFQHHFDLEWADPQRRLDLCPPKELIRSLNSSLAASGLGQISMRALAKVIRASEVAPELRDILLEVEASLG